jgi:hypothetical protein
MPFFCPHPFCYGKGGQNTTTLAELFALWNLTVDRSLNM